jgi:hypothetical protein
MISTSSGLISSWTSAGKRRPLRLGILSSCFARMASPSQKRVPKGGRKRAPQDAQYRFRPAHPRLRLKQQLLRLVTVTGTGRKNLMSYYEGSCETPYDPKWRKQAKPWCKKTMYSPITAAQWVLGDSTCEHGPEHLVQAN